MTADEIRQHLEDRIKFLEIEKRFPFKDELDILGFNTQQLVEVVNKLLVNVAK